MNPFDAVTLELNRKIIAQENEIATLKQQLDFEYKEYAKHVAELKQQNAELLKDAEHLRDVFKHDYPKGTYRIQISLGDYHYKKLIPIEAKHYIAGEIERIVEEIDAAIASAEGGSEMKASDLHDLQGALRDLRFIQASALVSAKVADTKIGKEYIANLNRLDTLLDIEKTKALREESKP